MVIKYQPEPHTSTVYNFYRTAKDLVDGNIEGFRVKEQLIIESLDVYFKLNNLCKTLAAYHPDYKYTIGAYGINTGLRDFPNQSITFDADVILSDEDSLSLCISVEVLHGKRKIQVYLDYYQDEGKTSGDLLDHIDLNVKEEILLYIFETQAKDMVESYTKYIKPDPVKESIDNPEKNSK